MSNKTISTTIEILGKPYSIRCPESEAKSLQQAAELLNQKMLEVKESGKSINPERIAIITALNFAHQFLQLDQQKVSLVDRINHKLTQLQDKLDTSLNKALQTELIYIAE